MSPEEIARRVIAALEAAADRLEKTRSSYDDMDPETAYHAALGDVAGAFRDIAGSVAAVIGDGT